MNRKILIMGLPGTGKTTLARALAARLNAAHYNADEVRSSISVDFGFSEAYRVEHARRMGWLCDQVIKAGCFAVADFICPTRETRKASVENGEPFIVWADRVQTRPFKDTNRLFSPPERFDIRVDAEGSVEYWAEQIAGRVRPVFDPQSPMFDFFSGMTAMGFLVATLFFFRFWVKTNDWLFFRFGFSFILFACNQFMLVVSDSPRDDQSTIYLLRLSGYILIVAAILGKTLLGRGASRQK